MNFGNRDDVRAVLCREAIFGFDAATKAAAAKAIKAFPPLRNRHCATPISKVFAAAVRMGLDPPSSRSCTFARMSSVAAWTKGPLSGLHALLKSRYRFVPYSEFLEAVHRCADALAKALDDAPDGPVGLHVLDEEVGSVKSNLWMLFLMMRHIKVASPKAFARLAKARACPTGMTSGLAVLLHLDDALYSGEQMINGILSDDPCEPRDRVSLVVVPYATTYALASLRKLVKRAPAKYVVVGSPETIPSAFDGPGMTVAKYLRTVPDGYRGVAPFSCTTVFEHKVADSLSLPPVFAKGSPRTKVVWHKPASAEDGRRAYKPRSRMVSGSKREDVVPALPALFRFGDCRVGHYRDLLERAWEAANTAPKKKN